MNNPYQKLSDFTVGETGSTRSRTVGAAEISAFSGITCDYTFLHTSQHEASKTFYGGRIAHGLLGCSMAVGQLSLDAAHTIGRTIPNSFLCGFDCKYRDIIRMDDSIRTEWKILAISDDPVQMEFGQVAVGFELVNQDNKAVYNGQFDLRVPKTSFDHGLLNPAVACQSDLWQPEFVQLDNDRIYNIADFAEGLGGSTSGRTLTETDVINFVSLTGDHSPLYVDQLYAEKSAFGRRIVPPMLVFNLSLGYWARDSWITRVKTDDTARDIGHLGDHGRFYEPVFIGDTIHCIYKICNIRASKNNPDRFIVDFGFQIVNQHNAVVQEGHVFLVKGKSH